MEVSWEGTRLWALREALQAAGGLIPPLADISNALLLNKDGAQETRSGSSGHADAPGMSSIGMAINRTNKQTNKQMALPTIRTQSSFSGGNRVLRFWGFWVFSAGFTSALQAI